MTTLMSIQFGDDGVQITYVEEHGIDKATGIAELKVLEIPHTVLDTAFLTDLQEAGLAIIEEARVLRRHPEERFRAPR